jgi:hypothetical protein
VFFRRSSRPADEGIASPPRTRLAMTKNGAGRGLHQVLDLHRLDFLGQLEFEYL